jgi:hypothetical protein
MTLVFIPTDINPLDLCVYLDENYEALRTQWRGFVAYCIESSLNGVAFEDLDLLIASSFVTSQEELFTENEKKTIFEKIRIISSFLASKIKAPPELALASFLDVKYVTHIYRYKKFMFSRRQEELIVAQWIESFHNLEVDSEVLKAMDLWNEWFQEYFENA